MSELGGFLERFYSPEPAFGAVRAIIRHTRKASANGTSPAIRPVIGRQKPHAEPEDASERTLSLWAVPPDHVRMETELTSGGKAEITVQVSNGEDTWKRFASGRVEKGSTTARGACGRGSLPTEYQRHFDRALIRQFFAAFTLELSGKCRVADRECLSIRAVQIPGGQLWPHWLAWEADEFDLAADSERPVLLSIVGKVAGETTEQHEVQEVAFDEVLDESLFTFEPRPEEAVGPATPVVERISLKAAISRAPFTVLRPASLPESDRLQCETMYYPVRPDRPGELVSLHYHGGTLFDHLWINQRSDRDRQMQELLEWEIVNVGERTFDVSDPGTEDGLRVVVFEQDGTYVDIISDMHLDELLEIAASFETAKERGRPPSAHSR